MSIKDQTEQVLRDIYLLLSNSEIYNKDAGQIIVDKNRIVEYLNQLSVCINGMMDEYGITQSGRDRLERESKKAREDIIRDANKQVEDIYAAAFLYTDEALRRALEIMQNTTQSFRELCNKVEKDFQKEQESVKNNKMEVRGQLRVFRDTDKYLKLIEEQNKAMEREKKKEKHQEEGSHYAKVKPDIKINAAYFEKMGIPLDEAKTSDDETVNVSAEKESSEAADDISALSVSGNFVSSDFDDAAGETSDEVKAVIPEIRVNLDAEYFKWRDSGLKIEEESEEEAKQEKRPLFGRKRSNKTEIMDS